MAKNLNSANKGGAGSGDGPMLTMSASPDFGINLRRLLYFHHPTAREAARTIGVTEQAVSGWLRGSRQMSFRAVMQMSEIYDVDPRMLSASPIEFAQVLADPGRMERAEANIERIKSGKAPTKQKPRATVTKLQPRRKS